MVFAAWREEKVGVYRLQAQLKVRDLAVAHPSGARSARIDTPVHYCCWGAGGRLAVSRLRGAGVVLPRHEAGRLENTAYGDLRVEICCLAGIREGELPFWAARHRCGCDLGTLSKSEAATLASVLSLGLF